MTPILSGRVPVGDEDAAGLTLVELMIAMLLLAILSAGALMALSGQQQSTAAIERTTSTLDSARASLDALARQIRVAKGGLPQGQVLVDVAGDVPSQSVQCPAGSGVVPVIEVIDSFGGSNRPDVLHILSPDGSAWGTSSADANFGDASVRVRTPLGDPPGMQRDEWAILTSYDLGILFRVRGVAALGGGEYQVAKTPAAAAWPGIPTIISGGILVRARWLRYAVRTDAFGGSSLPALVVDTLSSPALTPSTEPAAVGIEDLQVALGIDRDGNGVLGAESVVPNADEWVFNVPGETIAGTTGGTDCALANLRAVRISIVARATSEDTGARPGRPALEDRTAGSADGYFRVVLQTVVALRN